MVYYYGVIRLNRYQNYRKKSVRLITCSEYLAHSEPLFKLLKLLKIEDLYKLKILKFYYNLSYGLLPSYFKCYLDVLNVNTPCGYMSYNRAHNLKLDCQEQDSYLPNHVYYIS